MASSKGYLDFILEQLSELEEITHRAMMGEYVLYYRGRVFGGIYDDRFLVKPTESAKLSDVQAGMCQKFSRLVEKSAQPILFRRTTVKRIQTRQGFSPPYEKSAVKFFKAGYFFVQLCNSYRQTHDVRPLDYRRAQPFDALRSEIFFD